MINVTDDRWEHGSFFHWVPDASAIPQAHPWDHGGVFFGSGRYAIRALLKLGKEKRGWKRLWMPSYFCQEVMEDVVTTCRTLGVKACLYPDEPQIPRPIVDSISFQPGDVLYRVNYFGLRASLETPEVDRSIVEVIDDHAHDPWSMWAWQSDADWSITALRKTLPIPDGAVLWSNLGRELPEVLPVTTEHRDASLKKLSAMLLKSMYLKGFPVDKDVYRELASSGEAEIGCLKTSGISSWTKELISGFPAAEWRNTRWENYRTLAYVLEGTPWLRVMEPVNSKLSCPLGGIILFDTPERRDHVRQSLMSHRIYMTILWDLEKPVLDGIPQEHKHISRRMSFVHCDMRYNSKDIEKVAKLILKTGDTYSSVYQGGEEAECYAGT